MKDEILKINEGADVKRGYGKRTLAVANTMITDLREKDILPKDKEGKEYPVELWFGQTKDKKDIANLTFGAGASGLRYQFDEMSVIFGVQYNPNRFAKGGSAYVNLKDVDTEIKPALINVLKAYPAPVNPAQQRLYAVLAKLKMPENNLMLEGDREVVNVYAQLRTFENGKRKDEQYIAICSHTSPEKVYNLNLSVAGKIESIVAVDFANKDAEGHPHNEFAPVAKAQDIIAKEPDEALRACLTALVDEKVKTKEEVER